MKREREKPHLDDRYTNKPSYPPPSAYAAENDILYLETSAKNASNVKSLFVEIAKRLPTARQGEQRDDTFTIAPVKAEKKGCC